jgi:hypothetical protein
MKPVFPMLVLYTPHHVLIWSSSVCTIRAKGITTGICFQHQGKLHKGKIIGEKALDLAIIITKNSYKSLKTSKDLIALLRYILRHL